MLNTEEISPFKETVILYTLAGAMVLIGISWGIMFIGTLRNQTNQQPHVH